MSSFSIHSIYHPMHPTHTGPPGRAWLRAEAVEGEGQSAGLGSQPWSQSVTCICAVILGKSVTSLISRFSFYMMGILGSSILTSQN